MLKVPIVSSGCKTLQIPVVSWCMHLKQHYTRLASLVAIAKYTAIDPPLEEHTRDTKSLNVKTLRVQARRGKKSLLILLVAFTNLDHTAHILELFVQLLSIFLKHGHPSGPTLWTDWSIPDCTAQNQTHALLSSGASDLLHTQISGTTPWDLGWQRGRWEERWSKGGWRIIGIWKKVHVVRCF